MQGARSGAVFAKLPFGAIASISAPHLRRDSRRRTHALAAEALKVMNERRITVLFVVDGGRPVGILHVHDLLRAGII